MGGSVLQPSIQPCSASTLPWRDGRAEGSSPCAGTRGDPDTGWRASHAISLGCSLTGACSMEAAEQWEPDDARVSRPVLRDAMLLPSALEGPRMELCDLGSPTRPSIQLHVRVLWRLTMRRFVDRQPGTTPANVKLLLPPRQSRGTPMGIRSRDTRAAFGRFEPEERPQRHCHGNRIWWWVWRRARVVA
jgi:hypothetical protein